MFKKIYIYNEPNYTTGGVESIYQMVDAVNQQGGDASIVFVAPYSGNPVPERYRHYKINIATHIEDSPENLLIAPEVWPPKLDQFTHINKAIWWLSVDNNHGNFKDFSNEKITHYYQSIYALSHIIQKGGKRYLPMYDYIYLAPHLVDQFNREDVIVYNPAKGRDVTSKIMSMFPQFKYVALENMTNEQVVHTLSKSKIYMDFGHHPGKDRIPREAAALGCIVITSVKGSAMDFDDIPIPSKYKIHGDLNGVGDLFQDCINNHQIHYKDFDLYRSVIRHHKEELFLHVKQNFGL